MFIQFSDLEFQKRSNGFTLVETLLYLVILSTMLGVLTSFIFVSYQTRIKNQTIAEVEQLGEQVMNIITQTIRNSSAINTPAPQTNASSLSLDTYSGTTTPTVFELNSTNLRITEGAAAPINLTGSRLAASAVSFTNVSETGAPGTIRIQFTLIHNNPNGYNEYQYSKTFYGTASLRK